ncbi:MAG: Arylesterase [candidate division WS2 bacterium]|nr:Arylesterase [Candidatus Lithacetigena glycinireducens]
MYNILIFGDSIAAGRRVEKIKSWPSLLTQQLDKKDKDFTLVHNLSIPGESTNEVIKRLPIEAEVRCKKNYPDDHSSIIFAVGINDAKCLESRNNSITSAESFRNNISLLIENARKYTDHIIFIGLTPVDERKTAPLDNVYFLNKKIGMYEKIIGEECKKRTISFLNIAEEWSRLNYLKMLSEDGIHPNEKGHQKIFEKIKPLFI